MKDYILCINELLLFIFQDKLILKNHGKLNYLTP